MYKRCYFDLILIQNNLRKLCKSFNIISKIFSKNQYKIILKNNKEINGNFLTKPYNTIDDESQYASLCTTMYCPFSISITLQKHKENKKEKGQYKRWLIVNHYIRLLHVDMKTKKLTNFSYKSVIRKQRSIRKCFHTGFSSYIVKLIPTK